MKNGGWIVVAVLAVAAIWWLGSGQRTLAQLQAAADASTAGLGPGGSGNSALWPFDAVDLTGSVFDYVPAVPLDDPYASGAWDLPSFDPVLTGNG